MADSAGMEAVPAGYSYRYHLSVPPLCLTSHFLIGKPLILESAASWQLCCFSCFAIPDAPLRSMNSIGHNAARVSGGASFDVLHCREPRFDFEKAIAVRFEIQPTDQNDPE
jgi:hypothetical protein